jgi:hypothetical protein
MQSCFVDESATRFLFIGYGHLQFPSVPIGSYLHRPSSLQQHQPTSLRALVHRGHQDVGEGYAVNEGYNLQLIR